MSSQAIYHTSLEALGDAFHNPCFSMPNPSEDDDTDGQANDDDEDHDQRMSLIPFNEEEDLVAAEHRIVRMRLLMQRNTHSSWRLL